MLDINGKFTVKLAWQYIIIKEKSSTTFKGIWIKGLLFKMVFFIWRIWKGKVPVDDYIRRWGVEVLSKYWCCANLDQEIISRVFLRLPIANRTESYFSSFTGKNIQGLSFREIIMA